MQLLIIPGLLQRPVQAITSIILRQHLKNCQGVGKRNHLHVDSKTGLVEWTVWLESVGAVKVKAPRCSL